VFKRLCAPALERLTPPPVRHSSARQVVRLGFQLVLQQTDQMIEPSTKLGADIGTVKNFEGLTEMNKSTVDRLLFKCLLQYAPVSL
jgi:hypothetical protein